MEQRANTLRDMGVILGKHRYRQRREGRPNRTQQTFALKIGCVASTLSVSETGFKDASLNMLQRIADELGFKLELVLTKKAEKENI